MTSFWNRLKALLAGAPSEAAAEPRVEPVVAAPAGGATPEAAEDAHWQAACQARQAWYERVLGTLPADILKMRNLAGVWPGGGLYALPAERVAPGLWLYTTFGLSNPDMPARVTSAPTGDGAHALVQKPAGTVLVPPPGAAGYGYEFAVLARDSVQWPLWVLQWAVNAELLQDVNILDRVEKNGGLTVEDIPVDDGRSVHLLIAKARPPLPQGTALPAGRMDLLVATAITAEEMRWSMQHGRAALLDRLMASGAGQVSELGRASVV